VDFTISRKIADKLSSMGYDVVYPYEIKEFLEERHIIPVGWIDKITSKEIGRKFKVSLIILGTIIEYEPKLPVFVLNIRMLSLSDYKLIWAKTVSITQADEITFLNLNKRKWKEIVDSAIYTVLKNIPDKVFSKAVSFPDVDIVQVSLHPRYAKTGDNVTCNVKLYYYVNQPEEILLLLNNKPVKTDFYLKTVKSVWAAPREEGRYVVTLLAKWKAPVKYEKKLFLSSFFVDNEKPQVKLKLKKIIEIEGKPVFRKFIKIIPVIMNREVVSRWKLEIVSDKEKKAVIVLSRFGKLPKFFKWKGVSARGGHISNGKYILKLSVWDRAGNMSVAELPVFVIKFIPSVNIAAERDNSTLKIHFALSEKHLVKFSTWRFELYDDFGSLIAYKEGRDFPDKLDIKYNGKLKKKLRYSFDIKDVLGNRLLYRKRKLEIEKVKEERKRKKKIWVNEF
jgi:hypothetical protein